MSNNNLNILLTRPLEKSQRLATELKPFANHIEISPLFAYQTGEQHSVLKQQLKNSNFDIIIFVSQAAVDYAFQTISAHELSSLKYAFAVGNTTAQALSRVGITNIIVPSQHTSEGLLSLPQLKDISGFKVLIVRGNGGREMLKEQLQMRGAIVTYNEVYKRVWLIEESIQRIDKWHEAKINCIVVTSNELLNKTFELTKYCPWLTQCVWLVASKRIAENAHLKGLNKVINAHGADNKKIIEALPKITHPLDINYD